MPKDINELVLPGESDVDSQILDQAVIELNRIYIAKGLEAARAMGEYVLETFFDGSLEKAVAAHLSDPSTQLSDEEAERLAGLIRQGHSEEGQ